MSLFRKARNGGKGGGRHSSRNKELIQLQEERQFILNPKSDFFIKEAYKTLRTNVTFSLTDESQCKTIVITSSLQSEGKSLTAVNLAISFAEADKRVLLIDCDLRRPKLGRLLGKRSEVGLTDVLMDFNRLGDAIHGGDGPVDVLLAGQIPPNPSELLSSPRMIRLLDALKAQYDYIILDTPPINMVTDAVVLAPQSNGVLFVVRANQSERGAIIHAVEQLEYAQIKILGFVLNNVDLNKTNYGYGKYRYKRYQKYRRYGYNSYGYGYGQGYGYGYGAGQSQQPRSQEAEAPPGEQEPV